MELLKAFAHEAVGLFVADVRFVASVLVFIVAIVLGLRAALLAPTLAAILLALGVAALLVFDVVRVARASRPRRG